MDQSWSPSIHSIDRKPENGCEIQNSACGLSGVMLQLKLVKGVNLVNEDAADDDNAAVPMEQNRLHRFVAGGHTTDTPSSITYSSVVSRDSVRLVFLIAGLNDLDVLAGDNVTNAYLNAKCREKIWFKRGIKTGEDRGKVLIITRGVRG